MVDQVIVCPKCGERISASKALTQEIENELRRDFDAEIKRREKDAQLGFDKRLANERAGIEKQARKDAERTAAADVSRLQREIAASQRREQVAQASFDRRLTEEAARLEKKRLKAEDEHAKRIEAKFHSRQLELQKRLNDANKLNLELGRKLEQGSAQAQGDAIQSEWGEVLSKAFPEDKIEPIPKGRRGADVLQRVYSPTRQYCETILWESKNGVWKHAWLGKLRSDQRRVKAAIAVLVSSDLPKDVRHFGESDGVWVAGFPVALGLAAALRSNLIQVAGLKQSSKGNNDKKMELLYEYLSSIEFRQRIEAIVESFRLMQEDLEKERTMMEGRWAKRATQIRLVIQNVSGMYGDMQGIVGSSLPNIRRLELTTSRES